MRNNRHDISGTSYTRTMDEKITRYNNLVREAERINFARSGMPTKEEATFYYQAAKTCEEIMNLNMSQRSVYTQWKMRKQDCEENVKRITEILAPTPSVPPASRQEEHPAAAEVNPVRSPAERQQGCATTKSAFTTKNDCKDVPAETIEKWFDNQPTHGFEAVSGMEDLKKKLMEEVASLGWTRTDDELGIDSVQSFFLYGPPGTGKTHIIRAFANELGKKGFQFMQLMGSEIHASLVGVAEKTVQIAFQEAIDKEPCIIFIDEIDNVCVRRDKNAESHEKRLSIAFREALNLLFDSGKRVIFVGATNHPGMVDEAMLDRARMIRLPLPNEKAREAYFSRSFGKLAMEDGFSVADMAAITDNCSYRDMHRLKDSIAAKLKNIVIQENTVLDENGNMDLEATDIRASEAIRNGKLILTRALFEQTCAEIPPSDKSAIQRELREFEDRINRMGE